VKNNDLAPQTRRTKGVPMKFLIRSPLLLLLLLVALVSAFGALAAPVHAPDIALTAGPCYAPDTAYAIAKVDMLAPDMVLTAAAVLEAQQLQSEHYYFDSALTRETHYVKTPAVVRLWRERERAYRSRVVPTRRLFRVTPARLAG
jgi:hypothetical protein